MIRPRAQLHYTPDTRRDPAERTPCHGQSALFDSREDADHQAAKQLCATCPAIDACRANLRAVLAAPSQYGGSPEGTWAGKLMGGKLTARGAAQAARRAAEWLP